MFPSAALTRLICIKAYTMNRVAQQLLAREAPALFGLRVQARHF